MLEHRTFIGVVTGDAIHRFAVAWIECFFAHRVRETLVLVVAIVANLTAIFKHCRTVAAMPEVAV